MLYQDIDWFIHQVVVAYQHTVHSELDGLTPHEKWVEGLQSSMPLVPPATTGMERLFWRMSPDTRVITSKGVSAFGMHYWSPDLSRAERVGKDGRRIQFSFRYDPTDISRLALFRGGDWVGDVTAKQLRQPDGSTRSISLAERQLAQKMARNAGHSAQDWLRYIQDIDERNQTRRRERQTAQRQSRSNGHFGSAQGRRSPSTAPGKASDTENALNNFATTKSNREYTDLLAAFLGDSHDENP